LGFCVKLEQGDFIGREALLKIKEEGRSQKLCTLMLGGEDYQPIYGGEAVYFDGQVISRLRSGGYGFTVNRNIAFTYLPLDITKIGTSLTVELFDSHIEAQVSPDVSVDPKGERLRL
jgi:4-methylaminobutanoate oxidase (formaldehyde-forming)